MTLKQEAESGPDPQGSVLSHGTALGRGIAQMGETTIPEDPEVRGSCLCYGPGVGGCERERGKGKGLEQRKCHG